LTPGHAHREHATVKALRTVGLWLFLGLWPLLLGASVGVGSGPGWEVGESVALYSWWLPAMVFRRTTWPLRHQNWAFVQFFYANTTLFFVFLAGAPFHLVTRLPMWVCVLLAPVIGGGATAALWPAQRRFYAVQLALRSPAPLDASDS
jgi:hypothetical protein